MTSLGLLLRIGASTCFIGHGVLAFNGSAKYIDLLGYYGVSEGSAANLLIGIGCLDILVGLLLFFKPHRLVVSWAIGWTFMTIGAWALKEVSLWDMMRRINYAIIPLALLFYLRSQDKKRREAELDDSEIRPFSANVVKLQRLDPAIQQLDMNNIKRKLMELEEGEGWTMEQCNEVELEYKRYLQLKKMYPDAKIVPNRAIDIMWHYHILDTEAYYNDCHSIFGFFMHHYPYYGMNGKVDEANLMTSFDDTQHLYEKTYGESMERDSFLESFDTEVRDLEIVIG